MRLADREIEIELGGEIIELRPSLRYALRLSRLPGGFGRLADELTQGSLNAAMAILWDHHPHTFLGQHILDAGLDELAEPLLNYLMACGGHDPDAHAPANNGGESIPYPKFLEGLYKIGTGWLGWTPDQTLDATPLEILRAHAGRMDMLRAIYGGADDKPKVKPTPEQLSSKFRLVLGAIGTTKESQAA